MAAPLASDGIPPSVRKRPIIRRWSTWLAAAAVIGYGVAIAMHWDDRGFLWLQERFESQVEQKASVWLPAYHADIDAKVLPGMEKDEASDLAYDPQRKTLFAVMGKNPFLVELTLDGDVLRKIPLVGWSNPEGVAVMADGRIAIVDERLHNLVLIKLDDATHELNAKDFPQYDLGPSEDQNKAFESIAWDPAQQRLVLGEERPPRLFTWSTDGRSDLTGNKQELANDDLDLRNLSAIGIDPRTGHMLALSADSNMLLELDEKGEQVSFMTLLGGFNGLAKRIPRAEGVAMDEAGTLYMVSEPNLFYRFRKE
ncbi:SdiA-regulated domain-containing protein [Pseudomonas wadenswilerensis]